MKYLDTNVFVRFLTADQPEMTRVSASLFARIARSEEEVAVLEATVAEVVYVLSAPRFYNVPHGEIRDRLQALLSERGILMEHKGRCLRALDLFVAHRQLNFGDALLAAAVEDEPEATLYSFDRGFDRVEGITRIEP